MNDCFYRGWVDQRAGRVVDGDQLDGARDLSQPGFNGIGPLGSSGHHADRTRGQFHSELIDEPVQVLGRHSHHDLRQISPLEEWHDGPIPDGLSLQIKERLLYGGMQQRRRRHLAEARASSGSRQNDSK